MQKQIRIFNDAGTGGKELDPKADPVPGPGQYDLQEVWHGKKTKMRRAYSAQPKPGQQIQRKISKGPTVSIYYQK